MIEVQNVILTLSMEVEQSKVIIHPNYQSGKIKIDVEADDASNSGVRFFRFKMKE